eukprot:927484-Rhodomonas_salina.3
MSFRKSFYGWYAPINGTILPKLSDSFESAFVQYTPIQIVPSWSSQWQFVLHRLSQYRKLELRNRRRSTNGTKQTGVPLEAKEHRIVPEAL